VQIPCLHARGGDPLPEKLEQFLAAGPAPVYFGFGSMPDHDPRATTELLLAVAERVGCRALISRGWAELGEAALPEHVMAVGDVSHARLFPRTAAVVHHGGAGTTHSAARAGVPQIVVPHLLDQFYFARRVHELGVATPAIARRKLTVSRLAERVSALLDHELLAERAAELGRRLAALDPAEAHLAALIES
jgi:vancomycin aglycone glucosyltransferase